MKNKMKLMLGAFILTFSVLFILPINVKAATSTTLNVVKTGDTTSTTIFYFLGIASLILILWFLFKRKKDKDDQDDKL